MFIYRFHNYFDGLIDLDLLTKWEAKIYLKNKILLTQSSSNPIRMYNSCNVNYYEEMIPAGTSKIIRVPINASNGEVLVKKQIISSCMIRECPTIVKNNEGYLEVENSSPNDVIFSLDRPAQADIFNIECMRTKQTSECAQDVVTRLRTDQLNDKETVNLNLLYSRYSDVFYIEGEPLTFTNNVKHRIRTTDEQPVYTKSYRYPFVHRQEVRDQIAKSIKRSNSWNTFPRPYWI